MVPPMLGFYIVLLFSIIRPLKKNIFRITLVYSNIIEGGRWRGSTAKTTGNSKQRRGICRPLTPVHAGTMVRASDAYSLSLRLSLVFFLQGVRGAAKLITISCPGRWQRRTVRPTKLPYTLRS